MAPLPPPAAGLAPAEAAAVAEDGSGRFAGPWFGDVLRVIDGDAFGVRVADLADDPGHGRRATARRGCARTFPSRPDADKTMARSRRAMPGPID